MRYSRFLEVFLKSRGSASKDESFWGARQPLEALPQSPRKESDIW